MLTIRERQWGSLQAYGAHLLPIAWHHALADLHARPAQSSHPASMLHLESRHVRRPAIQLHGIPIAKIFTGN